MIFTLVSETIIKAKEMPSLSGRARKLYQERTVFLRNRISLIHQLSTDGGQEDDNCIQSMNITD